MECPSKNKSTNLVVETLEWHVVEVLVSALPSQESNTLEDGEDGDSNGGRPPDDWVADEVDLAVFLTPEVNTTAENWPGLWARIPGVRVEETSVGGPHDLLELPELAKETWVLVVDLLNVRILHGWVIVLLDVPDGVWKSSLLGASNLLLLGSPLRKLDLVGEKSATSHDVDEPELGLDSADSLLGEITLRLGLDYFNAEEVVGISIKSSITISGDLVLPLSLSHWWANIVGVKTSLCWNVPKLDGVAIFDVSWVEVVPSKRSVDRVSRSVKWLSGVLEEPDIVLILVWVESDLLLFGTSRVHKWVGVQVSTLGIVVSNADAGAECNIGWGIAHALGVESGLKLGTHESIAFSWVDEAEEVDREHAHVESDWDHNQAEGSGEDVLGHESWSDVLVVSEEDPELDNGQGSDPCDGEKSNPFHADSCAESESGHDEPEPPVWLEGLRWALLVLVCEGSKGQCGEAGANHEWGVEKNEASLSKQSVLCLKVSIVQSKREVRICTKDNEKSSHGCDHGTASSSLESQEHSWNQENTADSWQRSHPDVWDIWLEVILPDLLEVEVSVEAAEPSSKSNEELSKRWVDIHEESALNVLGSEATKAVAHMLV